MGSNNNRSNKWTRKKLLTQIGTKKRRGKEARMFFSLIYFFAPFSIFYILRNYVIPQAMSRAIPPFTLSVRDVWFLIGELEKLAIFSNYCTTSKTAEIKTVTIQSSEDRLKNTLHRK